MAGSLNLFCASGGGSKGAFEGGVLEALCDEKIELHGFVGVSTGSIQAGFMSLAPAGIEAQRRQLEKLRELWFGLKGDSAIYSKPGLGLIGLLARAVRGKPSLYTFAPLVELLERYVLSGPERPVRLGVVELESSGYHATSPTSAAELRRAILASCSIPVFFPPVSPDLVDGGVRNIAPLSTAFDLASELLRAGGWDGVNMYVALASPREIQAETLPWSGAALWHIGLRSLDILEGENYRWDVDGALRMNSLVKFFDEHPGYERPPALRGKLRADIRLFEPDSLPYSALEFNPAKIRAFWDAGCQKARAVLAQGPSGVLSLGP